jgi:hypothetical protein
MKRAFATVLAAGLLASLALAGCDGCSDKSDEAGDEPATGKEITSEAGTLPPVSTFNELDNETHRSREIFEAIGSVLKHPRCVNCHPTGDQPLMGDRSRPHRPMVVRGKGGMGAPGMRCNTCHTNRNYQGIPGEAGWRMAPAEMAWEGKSLSEICAQIKDPERNGGKSLDQLVEHMAEDNLVGYGWDPPEQYEPAPGSQKQLGELARAWVDSGAHCPE